MSVLSKRPVCSVKEVCLFFQKGLSVCQSSLSVLSKRCVCSSKNICLFCEESMPVLLVMCVYAFMCLLVSMMFLSSFWVLSFRTVVCYFFGWSSYSTFVPQFLGLCAFWLLYINSSPSYACFLQSKYNIHSQSKGMRRSSVFIIDVANSPITEKNVSDSAGVNESAASSHEVGSGSSRVAARRCDWTCLFYRLHVVWRYHQIFRCVK